MSGLTHDEEYRRQRMEEYELYRARTSMHAIDDWDEVLKDPNVVLPSNGSYYMIANHLAEITEFFYRLESIERWRVVGVVENENWGDEEELNVVHTISAPRSLRYNQFFTRKEQLQVYAEEEPHEVYEFKYDKDFLHDLTFPCLVQYSGDSGGDRLGEFEVNHCQILNLTGCPPRQGPVQIHLGWI